MKVKIAEIVTAQEVADAVGVSRRTITRKAEKAGVLVTIAGRGYVKRSGLRKVADDPSVEKLRANGTSEDEIDTRTVLGRSEAAELCKCDPATVWRVTRRFGIGIDCYGDLLLTKKMLPRIVESIGELSATPEEISEMKRRAVSARWNRRRAAASGKSGKGAAGSPSRRSRLVSR